MYASILESDVVGMVDGEWMGRDEDVIFVALETISTSRDAFEMRAGSVVTRPLSGANSGRIYCPRPSH